MSRDLTRMSAGQLLDWLLTQRSSAAFTVDMLLVARAAGVTDLDLLAEHPPVSELFDELAALTERGTRRIEPPLTTDDLTAIVEVGHRVYLDDRDNLESWLAFADLINAADHEGWKPRVDHASYWAGPRVTRKMIAALLDAGRGPLYARQLVARAVEHHVSPDTYGFTAAITPAAFADLAQSGLDGPALDTLTAEGVSMEDAIALVADGCPPGGIISAKRAGIPQPEWRTLLTGMYRSWFPIGDEYSRSHGGTIDPTGRGALSKGFTWEQLRVMADHRFERPPGWGDLLTLRYGKRRTGGAITLTPADVVRIAETDIPADAIERWALALTTASRDDRRPQFSKPLLRTRFTLEDLDIVRRLREAKVSPSNINDYRFAGCASVEDVLTAAKAGITGVRAKYLRETYGQTVSNWDRRKFLPTLTKLLAAHESDLAANRVDGTENPTSADHAVAQQ